MIMIVSRITVCADNNLKSIAPKLFCKLYADFVRCFCVNLAGSKGLIAVKGCNKSRPLVDNILG